MSTYRLLHLSHMCTWYMCICVCVKETESETETMRQTNTERIDSEQKITVNEVSFLVYFDSRHNSSPELSSPEDRKGKKSKAE